MHCFCTALFSFNGYQQCPNRGEIRPKVLREWTQCSIESFKGIECGFRYVVVWTEKEFFLYGNGLDVKNVLTCPCVPDSVLVNDDYLLVSDGVNIWRWRDEKWSEIYYNLNNDEKLWDGKITKMCWLQSNREIILLLSDGSVWKLDEKGKLCVLFTPTLERAVDIVSGLEHCLLLTENGCVMSFGNSSRGQLGHGDLDPSTDLLQILALGGLKVLKIAASGWHSAAVTDSGDLYLWGWNNFGQFSENPNDCSLTAVPELADIEGVIDVACGIRHTVVLTDKNEVFGTGWNEYGQLGACDKSVFKFTKIGPKTGDSCKGLKCGPWSTILYI